MVRLKSLSNSPNLPKFTYIYNIEYHFSEIPSNPKQKQKQKQQEDKSETEKQRLDLKQLCSTYKDCYKNSLLCVLLMKKTFNEDPIGGKLLIMLNVDESWLY